MNRYPFVSSQRGKILFGLFFAAMLFLARDTLVTSSILGFTAAQLLMLGLIVAAGGCFLFVNRKNWKALLTDRRMLAVGLFTAVYLLPMMVKGDFQLMYFSILIGAYFAIFLSFFVSLEDIAKFYVLLLSALGAYSVVAAYILRPLLIDTGLLKLPVFYNQIGVMFHNFGLSYVSDSYVRMRNFGIFREPGVYQFFLILALFLNNYTVSWEKERTMWILNALLAVTMITTLATGGVLELMILALVLFFERKLYKNKFVWLFIGVCAAVLGIALWLIIEAQGDLYWELYSMVIGKFQPSEDSFIDRFMSVFADLFFFFSHPLVGEKLGTVLHAVANNTTSTLVLYAVFGFFGGTLNLIAWKTLIWDKSRKRIYNLLLFGMMLLSFNTQNLTADLFFWLFPCMALVEKRLPGWKFPGKRK